MKRKLDINIRPSFSWSIYHIWIPIFPVAIIAIVNLVFNFILCNDTYCFPLDSLKLIFKSLGIVKFSFSVAVLSFFVSKDIANKLVVLSNADREEEVKDGSATFFVYVLIMLIFFVFLLLTSSSCEKCPSQFLNENTKGRMDLIYYIMNIGVFIFGVMIIFKARKAQAEFKLTTK